MEPFSLFAESKESVLAPRSPNPRHTDPGGPANSVWEEPICVSCSCPCGGDQSKALPYTCYCGIVWVEGPESQTLGRCF